ncbi:MAG: gluconolaconase [Rhizobiales bacterium 17-65-6]|uniref:SMP-30/gluconolactonase/LRE family protein n=1 Tax=Xanthobacter TaxID=279 RepID=UPI000BD42ADD|nr:MAG: gluconolaconase [Rhizobiales bacterium 12-68-15]OYX90562.1 MAG: gluconolaconase [Azorhizobium sp. 32-67-21]OYZ90401.1 MAG: gluconolaconase [Rhizobiales bacterium 17-65-6]
MESPELHILAHGLLFPEGPVFCADGSIMLVEIARGTVTRIYPDGTVAVVAETGGGPNGAALGPDGALYVCNNGGFEWLETRDVLRPTLQASNYSGGRIERVDLVTGAIRVLYTSCEGQPLRGPNDIVFDTHGGFYFSDMGKVRMHERDHGALYYASIDGTHITTVAAPLLAPNGVGLSPDGRILYVTETDTARLWAFDIQAPGVVRKLPWPSPHGGRLVAGLGGYQRFDSLAVDEAGVICVATLVSGAISEISPDGTLLRQWTMPDPYPTNICFGGDDLRTAYITLSGSGRLATMPWPSAGLPLNFTGRTA